VVHYFLNYKQSKCDTFSYALLLHALFAEGFKIDKKYISKQTANLTNVYFPDTFSLFN